MNYGISVLFRAIRLVMALFCFFYGGYIYLWGDDSSRMIAGRSFSSSDRSASHCLRRPPRSSRPDHPHVQSVRQVFSADSRILRSPRTFICGIAIFKDTEVAEFFVAGHIVCGLGLITGCVATAATVSTRFSLIPENSTSPSREINAKGFTQQQELIFESIAAFFAALAWAWTIVLLAGGSTPHFVAGSVMGGIACICTSLIALVASIVRQERNVYADREKKIWPRLVLIMGTIGHDLGTDRDLRLLRKPATSSDSS